MTIPRYGMCQHAWHPCLPRLLTCVTLCSRFVELTDAEYIVFTFYMDSSWLVLYHNGDRRLNRVTLFGTFLKCLGLSLRSFSHCLKNLRNGISNLQLSFSSRLRSLWNTILILQLSVVFFKFSTTFFQHLLNHKSPMFTTCSFII